VPKVKKVLQVAAFCWHTLMTHVCCTSKSCFWNRMHYTSPFFQFVFIARIITVYFSL